MKIKSLATLKYSNFLKSMRSRHKKDYMLMKRTGLIATIWGRIQHYRYSHYKNDSVKCMTDFEIGHSREYIEWVMREF